MTYDVLNPISVNTPQVASTVKNAIVTFKIGNIAAEE